jgi:hypothetical protein
MPRRHIVLVPGFVGFDVLGQLEYYVGTTRLFQTWSAAHAAPGVEPVLHYFDNFPTASVATRAYRLRRLLETKIARGEIARGDHLSLVGHSTGGLDIRQLLADLHAAPAAGRFVDGPAPPSALAVATSPAEQGVQVAPQDILSPERKIRIAFLSTPHHGTTIADFLTREEHRRLIQYFLRKVRGGLESNDGSWTDLLGLYLRAKPLNSELSLAILDALRESDVRVDLASATDPATPSSTPIADRYDVRRAYERQARSNLALWLSHMEDDFRALDDLRTDAPPDSTSPAHFSLQQRISEIEYITANGIHTRSYATRAPAPSSLIPAPEIAATLGGAVAGSIPRALRQLLPAALGGGSRTSTRSEPVRLRELISMLPGLPGALPAGLKTAPQIMKYVVSHPSAVVRSLLRPSNTDLVYTIVYSMCAYRPCPGPRGVITARELGGQRTVEVSDTDNDGIAGTRSMLFIDPRDPDNPDHQRFLVDHCDHADIIGHYRLQPQQGPGGRGRQHERYDFFGSGSGFSSTRFETIWRDVFDFCCS